MKQLVTLLLLLVLLTRPVLASDILVQPMPASDVAAVPFPDTVIQPSGAWMWSLLVPGLGQIVMGEPLGGSLLLGSAGLSAGITVWLVGIASGPGYAASNTDPLPMLMVAAITAASTLGIWLIAVAHAYWIDLEKQRAVAEQDLYSHPKAAKPVRL